MKRSIAVLFAVAVCASPTAFAGEHTWVEIARSKNMISEIDIESAKPGEYGREVWERDTFSKPQRMEWLRGKKTYDQTKALVAYQCGSHTYKTLSVTWYSDGEVVDSATNQYPPTNNIVPDSVGEAKSDYICGLHGEEWDCFIEPYSHAKKCFKGNTIFDPTQPPARTGKYDNYKLATPTPAPPLPTPTKYRSSDFNSPTPSSSNPNLLW